MLPTKSSHCDSNRPLFRCYLRNNCRHQKTDSHRVSFEFTFEGIEVYPGLFFSKEIFIPKEELLRASYVEVDVSDPDHVNSKACYLDFNLREVTQLEDIFKSNIIINTSTLKLRLALSLCRFREEEKAELATYLKENYGIDFFLKAFSNFS